jgi:hypothetical protein
MGCGRFGYQKEFMKTISTAILACIPFCFFGMNHGLSLHLTGNGFTDEIVVGMDANGSGAFDPNQDAWKLFSITPGVGQLYTQCGLNQPLSVYAMPLSALDTVINLYVLTGVTGLYQIKGHLLDSTFGAIDCIQLEEVASGQYFDLTNENTIPFTLPILTRQSPAPFRIHFKRNPKLTARSVSCYGFSDATLYARGNNHSAWSYSVTNAAGQDLQQNPNLIGSDSIQNLYAGTYFFNSNTTSGCTYKETVYIHQPLRVISDFSVSDSLLDISKGGDVQFVNKSKNASTYKWNFNDQTAETTQTSLAHTFASPGTYTVCLNAFQGSCKSQAFKTIHVFGLTTGIPDKLDATQLEIGLSQEILRIQNKDHSPLEASCRILDIRGRELLVFSVKGNWEYEIPVYSLTQGVILLQVSDGTHLVSKKLINIP